MDAALRSPLRTVMTGITAMFLATSYRLLPNIISDFVYVDKMGEPNTPYYNSFVPPEEFDFIVVGAGSAGALVAHRLSRHFKTLLVEAGGTPFPLQNVPAFSPVMLGHKDLDWKYYTVPQTFSCMSMTNRSSYWPSGKGLGGTSLLNFLAWNRGHEFDYDRWVEITGDKRWSYAELLPFFKSTERYFGRGNETYHGYKGEITIGPVPYRPLVKYFLGAAEELGYPLADLNAPYDEAFNEHVFNHINGERQSSYNAFIRPIEQEWRSDLTIRKYAFVTQILIQDHSPYRTYGIQYEQSGHLYTAISRREVILSAGVIGSPKLLMLSGIGPSEKLKRIGVKPIVNLPGVGQNLQDHVSTFVGPFTLENPPRTNEPLTYLPARDSRPYNVIEYLGSGRGPLTQSGSMASGFIALGREQYVKPVNSSLRKWPDSQLRLVSLPLDDDGLQMLTNMANLEPGIVNDYYGSVVNQDSFGIMATVSRPKSRGFMQLASNDPFEHPLIDPNYYSHADDMKMVLRIINKTLDLVENTKAFMRLGATLVKTSFPTCKHLKYRSEEYWECFSREYSLSAYHPCGTCTMGKAEDPNSVVDSSLKVKMVEKLRVIDCSVIPEITSADIHAACTVIAERGAQMILDEHLGHRGRGR